MEEIAAIGFTRKRETGEGRRRRRRTGDEEVGGGVGLGARGGRLRRCEGGDREHAPEP